VSARRRAYLVDQWFVQEIWGALVEEDHNEKLLHLFHEILRRYSAFDVFFVFLLGEANLASSRIDLRLDGHSRYDRIGDMRCRTNQLIRDQRALKVLIGALRELGVAHVNLAAEDSLEQKLQILHKSLGSRR